MFLYQTLAFTIHGKKFKNRIKVITLKYQLKTWNEEFELLDGSYSVSDIQDYFECILKDMEKRLIVLQ